MLDKYQHCSRLTEIHSDDPRDLLQWRLRVQLEEDKHTDDVSTVAARMTDLSDCVKPANSRGGDLGGQGDRPPQKVRWRGRRCFYPPQYLENVLQIYRFTM